MGRGNWPLMSEIELQGRKGVPEKKEQEVTTAWAQK